MILARVAEVVRQGGVDDNKRLRSVRAKLPNYTGCRPWLRPRRTTCFLIEASQGELRSLP